jgi:protoporphyrinogen oxidase
VKGNIIILGAGVTGLALGYESGLKIYEKNEFPGGICSSYYMKSGSKGHSMVRNLDENDYLFEYGGGHWIFGNDREILDFLSRFDQLHTYHRKASVYLPSWDVFVPYPLQNNLRHLPKGISHKIISDIVRDVSSADDGSMYDWLEHHFGESLSSLFFHPFHDLYTAGLLKEIQPQDGYKSPVDIAKIKQGLTSHSVEVGYNVSFVYPEHGLGAMVQGIAGQCDVEFNKEVVRIDTAEKMIFFKDGGRAPYSKLVTTLPLNIMQNITGISTTSKQDPFTSVLVLNVGARRGKKCREDHWIYYPTSASGFHRIGFYSNVDKRFLPASKRNGDYVSLYVEKAFKGGRVLSEVEKQQAAIEMIKELQVLDLIADVDVYDTTWIDVAYTWSYVNSMWRNEVLGLLPTYNIVPVGRYATWKFQGILDSLRDGLNVGASLS